VYGNVKFVTGISVPDVGLAFLIMSRKKNGSLSAINVMYVRKFVVTIVLKVVIIVTTDAMIMTPFARAVLILLILSRLIANITNTGAAKNVSINTRKSMRGLIETELCIEAHVETIIFPQGRIVVYIP
jgi:hypothetical protein